MKNLILLFSLIFSMLFLNAQNLERYVIGTTGSEFVNGNLTLSFTVGEVAVHTLNSGGVILTQGFQQPTSDIMRISGNVTYANNISTPLEGLQLNLMDVNNNIVQSITTDLNGYYLFDNVNAGEYTIETISSINHGGVNSTDALLVQKHQIMTDTLDGINLIASDVNLSSTVNAADGLLIRQRYVGTINNFDSGDWLFQTTPIDATQGDVVYDYIGICYGDVNGSYLPGQLRISTLVELQQKQEIQLSSNGIFNIPFYINNNIELNAVSLVIELPLSKIEVLNVNFIDNNNATIFNVIGNQLRISWLGENPLVLAKGTLLFNLEVETKALDDISHIDFNINQYESEFADAKADIISNVELIYPKLIVKESELFTVYPNPFSDYTFIEYSSEEPYLVVVFDSQGRKVNEIKSDNNQKVIIRRDNLSPGIYSIEMSINGNVVDSRKIIISD